MFAGLMTTYDLDDFLFIKKNLKEQEKFPKKIVLPKKLISTAKVAYFLIFQLR